MDFSWNDYMVIQDGVLRELAQKNNVRSASALANVFNASYLGMGKRENKKDLTFPELAEQFGIYEERKANKIDKDPDEILRKTDKILASAFPEGEQ